MLDRRVEREYKMSLDRGRLYERGGRRVELLVTSSAAILSKPTF